MSDINQYFQCPGCGKSIGINETFCPFCDYILDTSFLDEGDNIEEAPESSGRHQQTASSPSIHNMPEPGPNPDYGYQNTSAANHPVANHPVANHPVTNHPAANHPAADYPPEKSSSVDKDSLLSEEYQEDINKLWRKFVEISLPDKILLSGLVLGFLSLSMPWRIIMLDSGVVAESSGFRIAGWIIIILIAATLGVFFSFNRTNQVPRRFLCLGQLGIGVAGLLLSAASLITGILVAIQSSGWSGPGSGPGPAYGVFISILAWGTVSAGAFLKLIEDMKKR